MWPLGWSLVGVAALTGFYYKKIYGHSAGNEMAARLVPTV